MAAERVPYATAARELLRTTLLDAARDLLRDRPWNEVTMAQVAKAAGVSRQTLYNEFGSREEFAQAFVLREGDRFLAAVEGAVAGHDDPAAALAAAFDVFLTAASEDPLVRAVIAGEESDDLLRLVTTQGTPLVERTTERLASVILTRWPVLPAAQAALVSELLVRLAISFAALPATPAGMTGDAIAALLRPYVDDLLRERAR